MRVRLLFLAAVCLASTCAGETRVTVVDRANKPLAGARLDLVRQDGFQLPQVNDGVTSSFGMDARGGVVVPEASTSDTIFVFRKVGLGTSAFGANSTLPQTIVLSPAAELAGAVFDERGTSLAGALIGPVLPGPSTEDGDGFQPMAANFPPIWTNTGADGTFHVPDLPAGNYSFIAQAEGMMPKVALARTGEETTLSLAAGGTTISGLLVGSQTNAPLANTFVEADAGLFRLYSLTNEEGQFQFQNMPKLEFQFRSARSREQKPKRAKVAQMEAALRERQVLLLHDEGRTIMGRVVDAETSEALPDTQLVLSGSAKDAIPTRSSETGEFAFRGIDAFGGYMLGFDTMQFVYRAADGNWRENLEIPAASVDLTTVVLPLMRRAGIHGVVTDAGGKPVSRAQVQLRSLAQLSIGPDEFARAMTYDVATDHEGKFRMSVYPPGRYEARARAVGAVSRLLACDASATRPAELVLPLRRAVQLHGQVADAQGVPVAEATVEMDTESGATAESVFRRMDEVATDTNGAFTFVETPAETIRLVATHPSVDEACTTIVQVQDSGSTSVLLTLGSGTMFRVHVTGEGASVSSATVQLTFRADDGATLSQSMMLKTASDGRAMFRSVGAKAIDGIRVRHADYAPFFAGPISLPFETDYEVRLTANPAIEVTLKSGSGAPAEVADPGVWLMQSEMADSGTEPAPAHFKSVRQSRPEVREVVFRNVEPGWYKAAAVVNEMYSESAAIRVTTSTQCTAIHLVVGGSASVQGRVTDEETNKPVSGATVSLLVRPRVAMELQPIVATTDSDGRYTLKNAPAGTFSLAVDDSRYPYFETSVSMEAGAAKTVDLRLGKSSLVTVQGEVRLEGKPLSGAAVVVHRIGQPDSWLGASVTDAKGGFTLEGVPPGSHTIVMEAVTGGEAHARRISRALTVEKDMPAVRFELHKTVTVSGQVRLWSHDGEPRRVLSVWFTPQSYTGEVFRTNVDGDGHYAVQVEPGPYKVSLFDGPPTDFDVLENAEEMHADFEF